MLIAVLVFFAVVVLLEDVTLVLVVAVVGENVSLNGGALESGMGLLTAPANVPVVVPLPPDDTA